MAGRGITEVVLLLGAVFLMLAGAFIGMWFADRGTQPEYILLAPQLDSAPATAVATVRPTFTPPAATPIPTAASAAATPTLESVGAAQGVPLQPVPTADPRAVSFQVIASEVYFYHGPGSAYPPIAVAPQGALLPITERTADGLWWQVCCLDGAQVWMRMDGSTLLASGDANLVPLSSAVVRDLPPTPAPIAFAPPPPERVERVVEAPVAPPTPTEEPLPPGNPACATGESYATIAPLGESDPRPPALNPEINLALRGYAPVDGFRQMVGIGGHTDIHAPQFNTLFADQRITQDFPVVYQAREWNYDCDCRGGPIAVPEVTVLGVSSHAGERLYTPSRTEGDIGEGFVAMVLYATPDSLTLKYTREDNMLMGYGLHLDGVCVDPTLLELYRQQHREGRSQLPALRGGQAIGTAAGGELRIAVRDTGQFMDPRSQKDWWMGN